SKIAEIEIGSGNPFGGRRQRFKRNHACRFARTRQRIEKYRANPTEDGCARPDANSDSQNSDGAKARILAQHAQAVAQVLQQRFHQLTSTLSSTTRPSNMWMVRSACREKRGSCVTMQMVAPSRCKSRNRSITASALRESRFPVGSSASRMAGEPANARATATRCCWPPESCEG